MALVDTVTIYSDAPWSDGLVKRRYNVTLMDNFGVLETWVSMPVKVDPSDDGSATGAAYLESKKQSEPSFEDKIPRWLDTQADYDRLSLGRAMVITDVDDFYAYLPLFKAMESRGGANANQRASYLGVSTANYNLMADRFGDVEGIAFFLDNANGQIWDDVRDFD